MCEIANLLLNHCDVLLEQQPASACGVKTSAPGASAGNALHPARQEGHSSILAGGTRGALDSRTLQRAEHTQGSHMAAPAAHASSESGPGTRRVRLERLAMPLEEQSNNKGRLMHYYSSQAGDEAHWCAWHDDLCTITGAALPLL